MSVCVCVRENVRVRKSRICGVWRIIEWPSPSILICIERHGIQQSHVISSQPSPSGRKWHDIAWPAPAAYTQRCSQTSAPHRRLVLVYVDCLTWVPAWITCLEHIKQAYLPMTSLMTHTNSFKYIQTWIHTYIKILTHTHIVKKGSRLVCVCVCMLLSLLCNLRLSDLFLFLIFQLVTKTQDKQVWDFVMWRALKYPLITTFLTEGTLILLLILDYCMWMKIGLILKIIIIALNK